MNLTKMLDLAKENINNAHVPYSNFTVSAVLQTKSGKFYTGVNVENHGIQSICAERCAFVKAISEGEKDFESLLVIAKNKTDVFYKETLPCGYCRQFMSEFCSKNFQIFTYESSNDNFKTYKLEELLPHSFDI